MPGKLDIPSTARSISRCICTNLLVLAMGSVFVAPACAQGPRRNNSRNARSVAQQVFRLPGIYTELQIEQQQGELVHALIRDLDEQTTAAFSDPAMPQPQRTDILQQVDETAGRILQSLLDDDQWLRYQEIRYQTEGHVALLRPDLITKLKLSKEQVDQIKELAIDPTRPRGRFGFRRGLSTPRNDREKKLAEILDQDQQSAWSKLKGIEFRISRQRPR